MTGNAIINAPADIRTDQIAQRAKNENQADLIQRAGGMGSKLQQSRSIGSNRQSQEDEGEIVCGSSDAFLIHEKSIFYLSSLFMWMSAIRNHPWKPEPRMSFS